MSNDKAGSEMPSKMQPEIPSKVQKMAIIKRSKIPSKIREAELMQNEQSKAAVCAMKQEFARVITDALLCAGLQCNKDHLRVWWHQLRGYNVNQVEQACNWWTRQQGDKFLSGFFSKIRNYLSSRHGVPGSNITPMGVIGGTAISYSQAELQAKLEQQKRQQQLRIECKQQAAEEYNIRKAEQKQLHELAARAVQSPPPPEAIAAAEEQRQMLKELQNRLQQKGDNLP